MKNIFIAALLLVSGSAMAQESHIRLNGYTNYVFDDRVDSRFSNGNYFSGKIRGGFQWGAGLEFLLSPHNAIEITYYNQSTTAIADYLSSGGLETGVKFNVGLNWIMLNGVRHFKKPGGKFEFDGGLGLGACVINTTNTKTNNDRSVTKFAWQLRGGGTFWASDRIGIKLNAQLQSAVQSVGGGFYIGTGGSGVGVTSFSTFMQFGLGGGLAFKLGGNQPKK